MQRTAFVICFTTLTWCANQSLFAQGMISRDQAARAGLVVEWFTQLEGVGPSELVNLQLVVDENQSTTQFEVVGGQLREVVNEKDISPFGEPFGVDEAERFANIRAEVMQARLTAQGSSDQVKVNRYTLPKSTIFSISNSGIVQSVNAETGRTNWKIQIGTRSFPTAGVGAGNKYVAAVNGSSVYCLDAVSGKLMWQRKCNTAVMGAPSVTDTAVFVPLVDGRLQVFQIGSQGHDNRTLTATGRAVSAPTLAGNTVSWSTDSGLFSVAPAENIKTISYRLRGDSGFLSPATARGGMFFIVSAHGFVYAIDQDGGFLEWSFSLGERVSQSPIPLGDYLYVISDENSLYKFDARSGLLAPGWEEPLRQIGAFVGASKERIYVQAKLGAILVLDQKTGSRLGSITSPSPLKPLANFTTDRIYVCNPSGVIQCLREASAVAPYFHADEFTAVATAKPAAVPGAEPTSEQPAAEKPADDADPFAEKPSGEMKPKPAEKSDDPFGGDSKTDKPTKPAGDDPFGGGDKPPGGDDPFGGSDKKPGDKPGDGKGGGKSDDPFGGGF